MRKIQLVTTFWPEDSYVKKETFADGIFWDNENYTKLDINSRQFLYMPVQSIEIASRCGVSAYPVYAQFMFKSINICREIHAVYSARVTVEWYFYLYQFSLSPRAFPV